MSVGSKKKKSTKMQQLVRQSATICAPKCNPLFRSRTASLLVPRVSAGYWLGAAALGACLDGLACGPRAEGLRLVLVVDGEHGLPDEAARYGLHHGVVQVHRRVPRRV